MHWAVDLALALRYRSDCVTLCSLGLFSNITWVAMLCTVLVGGTMVIMPSFDANAALQVIARERVSHGTFVPVQLEGCSPSPISKAMTWRASTHSCVAVRRSALDVKRDFPRRFGCNLIELYGLTEGVCTVLATGGLRTQDRIGRQALRRHRPAHRRR